MPQHAVPLALGLACLPRPPDPAGAAQASGRSDLL